MFRVQFDASAAQLRTNLQANLNNQARALGWRWRVHRSASGFSIAAPTDRRCFCCPAAPCASRAR